MTTSPHCMYKQYCHTVTKSPHCIYKQYCHTVTKSPPCIYKQYCHTVTKSPHCIYKQYCHTVTKSPHCIYKIYSHTVAKSPHCIYKQYCHTVTKSPHCIYKHLCHTITKSPQCTYKQYWDTLTIRVHIKPTNNVIQWLTTHNVPSNNTVIQWLKVHNIPTNYSETVTQDPQRAYKLQTQFTYIKKSCMFILEKGAQYPVSKFSTFRPILSCYVCSRIAYALYSGGIPFTNKCWLCHCIHDDSECHWTMNCITANVFPCPHPQLNIITCYLQHAGLIHIELVLTVWSSTNANTCIEDHITLTYKTTGMLWVIV